MNYLIFQQSCFVKQKKKGVRIFVFFHVSVTRWHCNHLENRGSWEYSRLPFYLCVFNKIIKFIFVLMSFSFLPVLQATWLIHA